MPYISEEELNAFESTNPEIDRQIGILNRRVKEREDQLLPGLAPFHLGESMLSMTYNNVLMPTMNKFGVFDVIDWTRELFGGKKMQTGAQTYDFSNNSQVNFDYSLEGLYGLLGGGETSGFTDIDGNKIARDKEHGSAYSSLLANRTGEKAYSDFANSTAGKVALIAADTAMDPLTWYGGLSAWGARREGLKLIEEARHMMKSMPKEDVATFLKGQLGNRPSFLEGMAGIESPHDYFTKGRFLNRNPVMDLFGKNAPSYANEAIAGTQATETAAKAATRIDLNAKGFEDVDNILNSRRFDDLSEKVVMNDLNAAMDAGIRADRESLDKFRWDELTRKKKALQENNVESAINKQLDAIDSATEAAMDADVQAEIRAAKRKLPQGAKKTSDIAPDIPLPKDVESFDDLSNDDLIRMTEEFLNGEAETERFAEKAAAKTQEVMPESGDTLESLAADAERISRSDMPNAQKDIELSNIARKRVALEEAADNSHLDELTERYSIRSVDESGHPVDRKQLLDEVISKMGGKVTDVKGGHRIEMQNGKSIMVEFVDNIDLPKSGKYQGIPLKSNDKVVGQFFVDKNGVFRMRLAPGAKNADVTEELLHAAKKAGLYTDDEWAELAAKHAAGITNEADIEEAIVKGIIANKGSAYRKIVDFIKANILRAGEKVKKVLTGKGLKEDSLFSRVFGDSVESKSRSGSIWKRKYNAPRPGSYGSFVKNMKIEPLRSTARMSNIEGMPNARKLWETKGGVARQFELQGLKSANDTGGHAFGDLFLDRFGKMLQKAAPGKVYHINGQKFAVLANDEAELQRIFKKIDDVKGNFKYDIPEDMAKYDARDPVIMKGFKKNASNMTRQELNKELLTSTNTGLPNERAFNESVRANPNQIKVSIDVDGLGTIKEFFGDHIADKVTAKIGEIGQQFRSKLYHFHGDEYAVLADSKEEAEIFIKKLAEDLSRGIVKGKTAEGEIREIPIKISSGMGKTLGEADAAQYRSKYVRENRGIRTPKSKAGIESVSVPEGTWLDMGRERYLTALRRDTENVVSDFDRTWTKAKPDERTVRYSINKDPEIPDALKPMYEQVNSADGTVTPLVHAYRTVTDFVDDLLGTAKESGKAAAAKETGKSAFNKFNPIISDDRDKLATALKSVFTRMVDSGLTKAGEIYKDPEQYLRTLGSIVGRAGEIVRGNLHFQYVDDAGKIVRIWDKPMDLNKELIAPLNDFLKAKFGDVIPTAELTKMRHIADNYLVSRRAIGEYNDMAAKLETLKEALIEGKKPEVWGDISAKLKLGSWKNALKESETTSFLATVEKWQNALDNWKITGAGINHGGVPITAHRENMKFLEEAGYLPTMEKVFDVNKKISQGMLKYAYEKGLIGEKEYRLFSAKSDYYTPLARVFDDLDKAKFGKAGSDPFKKFVGSERDVESPLVSIVNSFARTIEAADKNEMYSIVAKSLDEAAAAGEETKDLLDSIVMHVPKSEAGKPGVVTAMVNGEKRYLEFLDKGVAAQIDQMEKIDSKGTFFRLLTMPSKLLRYSLAKSPFFSARNFTKDAIFRPIVSDYGSTVAQSLKRYSKEEQEAYRQFGGIFGGWQHSGKQAYQAEMGRHIRELSKDKNIVVGTLDRLQDMLHNGLDWVDNLTAKSETQGRMAEFVNARNKIIAEYKDAGVEIGESSLNILASRSARDLLDFDKIGSFIRDVNQVIPFVNPAIRGTAKFFHAGINRPGRTAIKMMQNIGLPSIGVMALAHEMGRGEEYHKLPAWRRDFYYNIPLPGGRWFTVMKPFEAGVFGTMYERMLGVAMGYDKPIESAKESAGSAIGALLPVSSSDIMGPFKSVVEVMVGKNMFTGQDIIPPFEKNLDLELRMGRLKGSNFGKFFEDIFGIDRRNMDHIAKGMFTDYGRAAVDLTSPDKGTIETLGRLSGFFRRSSPWGRKDTQQTLKALEALGLSRRKQAKEYREAINKVQENPTVANHAALSRAALKVNKYIESVDKDKLIEKREKKWYGRHKRK